MDTLSREVVFDVLVAACDGLERRFRGAEWTISPAIRIANKINIVIFRYFIYKLYKIIFPSREKNSCIE
ncbi:hypothetical protein DRQ33_08445 [bacterium]|nr:MAG: hypothetical protein DRQ33_08445 [bacterium]